MADTELSKSLRAIACFMCLICCFFVVARGLLPQGEQGEWRRHIDKQCRVSGGRGNRDKFYRCYWFFDTSRTAVNLDEQISKKAFTLFSLFFSKMAVLRSRRWVIPVASWPFARGYRFPG